MPCIWPSQVVSATNRRCLLKARYAMHTHLHKNSHARCSYFCVIIRHVTNATSAHDQQASSTTSVQPRRSHGIPVVGQARSNDIYLRPAFLSFLHSTLTSSFRVCTCLLSFRPAPTHIHRAQITQLKDIELGEMSNTESGCEHASP